MRADRQKPAMWNAEQMRYQTEVARARGCLPEVGRVSCHGPEQKGGLTDTVLKL